MTREEYSEAFMAGRAHERFERDPHRDVRPITRESFLAAFVDANPLAYCGRATETWDALHSRDSTPVGGGREEDSDP